MHSNSEHISTAATLDLGAARLSKIEIINIAEFAKRIAMPESWCRAHTRARAVDVIPHLKMGKYTRIEWGSEPVMEWIAAHRQNAHGRK